MIEDIMNVDSFVLQKRKKMKILCLVLCFLLPACNIPVLFWEEEGRKVVDDVVNEEEKITPPAPQTT